MKLTEEQQRKIIEEDPTQMFDICSKCNGVQLYNTMDDINEWDWDLICDECKSKESGFQHGFTFVWNEEKDDE